METYAPTGQMALPGFTASEFERIAGLAAKTIYREIRLGRIRAYVDSNGQYRISPFEGYKYLANRE